MYIHTYTYVCVYVCIIYVCIYIVRHQTVIKQFDEKHQPRPRQEGNLGPKRIPAPAPENMGEAHDEQDQTEPPQLRTALFVGFKHVHIHQDAEDGKWNDSAAR